jgi:hypothetical protein
VGIRESRQVIQGAKLPRFGHCYRPRNRHGTLTTRPGRRTFTGLSGAANVATTAPLILGPFLVWSVVAGWAARATGSLRLGLLAAVWCAMVTMMIGVTYGFVLALATPGRLAQDLVNDPDYLRSGWTDVRAFVLANSFDNGFTHLLGGLIVASVVGPIGSLVGTRLARSRRPQLDRPDEAAL